MTADKERTTALSLLNLRPVFNRYILPTLA